MADGDLHSIAFISKWFVMTALFVGLGLGHPLVSHAYAPHLVGPVCCAPDDRGPAGFQLAVAGTVDQGAIVTVQLANPNYPGLVIARDLGNGRAEGPDPASDTATGLSPLGSQPAGTTQLAWDLKLHGAPLASGNYIVFLEIFEADGRPTSIPPSPEYAKLTIGDDGSVSVNMGRTADLET